MERVFLQLVNMSISAGWLVLAILPLRLLLKKAPRWAFCALWGLVGLRLLLPVSIESAMSLIPSAETIPPSIVYEAEPEIHSGIPALNSAVNPVITESFAPDPTASANPLQIWSFVAANAWLIGLTAMLLYALISYSTLRARMRTATIMADGVYQSELAGSPFVLGIFKPAIYLPYSMDGEDVTHVIAHERAHIARRDHLIKPFAFLLLSVYWFNPLMWLAYILLARDIEMACDQKVAKGLDDAQRRAYSTALLNCSMGRAHIAACPLAFGEVSVKERVKGVLNYKKPGFWIVAAAVLACAVAAACFLTNPKGTDYYLDYKKAAKVLEDKHTVSASRYFEVLTPGVAQVEMCEADAGALAEMLKAEDWAEMDTPSGGMFNAAHAQHPGSIKFVIDVDYGMTLYGDGMAAIAYGEEARYYSTPRDAYDRALALAVPLDGSPLNYGNAAAAAAAKQRIYGTYRPVTGPEDTLGAVIPVEVDGAALASLLRRENWIRDEQPPVVEQSEDSYISFIIDTVGNAGVYSLEIYNSPRLAVMRYGEKIRCYRTGQDAYKMFEALLDTAPFGKEYRVEEVLYNAPQYSFFYTEKNAPYYRLGEDMALHVLEDEASDNLLHPGYFSAMNLTEDNFDRMFEANGSGDWMGWRETAGSIRENNRSAWYLAVGEREGVPLGGGVFFYLIYQRDGGVYLAQGYRDDDPNTPAGQDGDSIRWLFRLATVETAEAVAYSGANSVPMARYAAGVGLDDIRSGVEWLMIEPNEDESVPFRTFVNGKESYGRYGAYDAETLAPLEFFQPSGLEPQTYVFQKAIPGRRYIVTMQTEDGILYCFGAELEDYAGAAGIDIEGMTPYRSTRCAYLNPLSSTLKKDDSGLEYRLGENSFAVINRSSGEVMAMSSLLDWEWLPLREASWEWADQLWPNTTAVPLPESGGLDMEKYVSAMGLELGGGYYMMNLDSELFIVETRENPQMGQYIWSVYGIAPAIEAEGQSTKLLCSGDFDGDGLEDRILTKESSPGALSDPFDINISYGSGHTVWMGMAGSWFYPPKFSVADFDGDGTDDFLVVLEHYGSNYGASEARVYLGREVVPALGLIAEDVIEANEEIFKKGINGFSGGLMGCIGARVLEGEGKDLLRVRMLKDYDPGAGITTAWYVDLELDKSRWDIADVQVGEAYGEDRILHYDVAKARSEWRRGRRVFKSYVKSGEEEKLSLAGGMVFDPGGMEPAQDAGYTYRAPGLEYDLLEISLWQGRVTDEGTPILERGYDGEELMRSHSLYEDARDMIDGLTGWLIWEDAIVEREDVVYKYTTYYLENPSDPERPLYFRFLNAVEENGRWQVMQSESDCVELMETLRFAGA